MTLDSKTMALPENLTVRPVTLDDLERGVAFIRAEQTELFGFATETLENLRQEWEEPEFDLEKSTRALFTSEGEIIAYAEIWDGNDLPVRPHLWMHILPDYRNRGLERQLSEWALERVKDVFNRVPEDARVVLESTAYYKFEYGKQLLRDIGMSYADRSWWHMVVEWNEQPPQPIWSEGIRVVTYEQLQDPWKVFMASRAAFRDHRGYVEPKDIEKDFEKWKKRRFEDPEHDPSLWFLAMAADEVVGVSLCRPTAWLEKDEGYVATLGVVRDYRKRGIALALLNHTFNAFWKRGQKKVGLHVDGSSITGATRLYERAGMRVDKAFDAYELELRPGRELTQQGQSEA